ncbi:MAG: formylglycine-generating enzyme family protein, partial [candidate division Zixibacteria bacterium]|nr:formylglycine-generating enzyme family protein [candidate division Zixibacteria bacterium]
TTNWNTAYNTVTASSTYWDTAYLWGDHSLAGYFATSSDHILPIANGGTGTSTAPSVGQMLIGNASNGYSYIASTSFVNTNGLSSNGIVVRTAANTYTTRYATGTLDEIVITNGDGVSDNITIGLPSVVYLGSAGKIGRDDADNLIDFSVDNQITFRTNASNNMVLDANGYLGIGTTSPAYLLDVYSSTTDYIANIYNPSTSASSSGLSIRVDGDGPILNLNYAGTDVVTVTGAQSTFNNPVVFGSAGDVSMAYDLYFTNDTAGNINFQGPGYIRTDSAWQNLDLTLEAANAGDVVIDDTAVITGTSTIADTLYINANTDRVGIGTSTPATTFTLQGTGSIDPFNIASSSGASMLYITKSGYVGIGTTSDMSELLTVDGNIAVTGTVDGYDISTYGPFFIGSAGSNGQLWTSDGSGAGAWAATSSLGLIGSTTVGNLTNNYISKWDGAAFANSLVFDTGTYVGIGTTTPNNLLDVFGNIGLRNVGEARFYEATSTGGNYFAFKASTTMDTTRSWTLPTTAGVSGNALVVDTAGNLTWSTPSGTGGTIGTASAIGQIPYYAAADNALTPTSTIFISTTEKVGIGTTTPLSRLSVLGNIFMDGPDRYINFGATTSTGVSGYGLRDNSGIMEYRDANGGWYGMGTIEGGNISITSADNGDMLVYDSGASAWVDKATNTLKIAITDTTGTLTAARGGTDWDSSSVSGVAVINNGSWGSSSTLPIYLGGTGTSTTPSTGQMLIGNASGGYNYIASTSFVNTDGLSSNGIMVRTAANTYTTRFATGTIDEIVVLNGDGVSGNPTINLPDIVYLGSGGKIGRDADNLVDFSTDNQITFRTNASNNMVLDMNGNLGIGTTTPSYTLDILGSGNLFRVATSGGDVFSITESQITSYVPHSFAGSGDVDIAGDLYFSNTTNSNISSYGPLYVTSGDPGTNNNLYLEGRGTGQVYIDDMITVTGTSSIAGILYANYQTGRVGIGTSSPLVELSVYGDAFLEGSDRYLNFGTATGTGGYGFWDDSGTIKYKNSTGDWAAFSTSTGSVVAGTQGQVAYYSADGIDVIGTSSLFINTNGNIGIGTTSPLAKLTIYDNIFLEGASRYINFGATSSLSSTGYGLRDNSGTMEYRNANGGWYGMGTIEGGSISITSAGNGDMLVYDSGSSAWVDKATNTLKIAITDTTGILTAARGGTNWDSSSASGVAIVNNGSWGASSTLPIYLGGTGTSTAPSTVGLLLISNAAGGYDYVASSSLGGGFGTVNSASAGQLAYYSADGMAVSGTSNMYISGSNVGVGTSAPLTTFSIEGTAGTDPFSISSSTGASMFYINQNGNIGIGTTTTSNKLTIMSDSGNAQLRLSYDADTYTELSVASNGEFTINSSGSSGSVLTMGDGTAEDVGLIFAGSANSFWLAIDDTNDTLNIGTSTTIGSTTLLTILNNGNIGVSSSSPNYKFTVNGSLYATDIYTSSSTYYMDGKEVLSLYNGMRLYEESGNGSNYLRLAAPDTLSDDVTWTLPSSDGTSGYALTTDGSGQLSWSDAGSGGSLNYGATGSLAFYASPGSTATGTDISKLFWNNTNSRLGIGTSAPLTTFSLEGTAGTDPFSISSSTGASLFYINQTGYVGIGTNNPNYILEVADTYGGDVLLTRDHSSVTTDDLLGQILFDSTDGSVSSVDASAMIRGYASQSHDSGNKGGYLTFETKESNTNGDASAIERMRITHDGKIGFGTTAPLTTFSLEGTAGTDPFNISSSTGASMFYINQDGNVGIGTTAPASLFAIDGNAGAKTGLEISNLGTANIGIDLSKSGLDTVNDYWIYNNNSTYWAANGKLQTGIITIGNNGSAASPSLNFMNGDTTGLFRPAANTLGVSTNGTERLRIDANGYVGIGTTGPAYLLDIYASTTDYLAHIYNPSTSASSSGLSIRVDGDGPILNLNQNGTDVVTITGANSTFNNPVVFGSAGDVSMAYDLILTNGSAGNILFKGPGYIKTDSTWENLNLTLSAANDGSVIVDDIMEVSGTTTIADTLYINANTDRVGVGTSAPSATFSLKGSAGTNPFNISSSTGASLFFIGADGNVGIGTDSINAKLTVDGDTHISGHFYSDGSIYGDNLYLGYDSSGGTISTYNTNENLTIDPNGTGELYILTNVGIGTSAPLTTFSLEGTAGTDPFSISSSTGDSMLYVAENGNVGIGTNSPSVRLSVVDTTIGVDDNIMVVSTSTTGAIFKIQGNGEVYADGSFTGSGADYAEYFYTSDTNLEAGEAVCVDVSRPNAVRRCDRVADGNVMGIVSTKPAIIGNAKSGYEDNNNYAIIGMLGQVPAKVSTENGEIRPGDSLTPATDPGYIMRAEAGDPTVGVALEQMYGDSDAGEYGNATNTANIETGTINVLISRRNKSLTVEMVETRITDRIAAMEIEDEVEILLANAVEDYNIASSVELVVDEQIAMFDAHLTVEVDGMSGEITTIASSIDNLTARMLAVESDILDIGYQILDIDNKLFLMSDSSSSSASSIVITDEGNIRMGDPSALAGTSPYQGEEDGATSTVEIYEDVAVVEIVTATTTDIAAFIVNQQGDGDVADFRYDGVSIVNIADSGKVSVVGEMSVDGRLMVCSGAGCGSALDLAVDETMGDMGVEGKVVAGAFESYCEDGYIWVPGSAKYGTMPGFCVSAHEATSELSFGYPKLSSTSSPAWVNVSQGEAMLECQGAGEGYHLITENEWMTIAENAIRVNENDVDHVLDGLQLAVYNANAANDMNKASSTSIGFTLSNGNIIYDLVGGVGEWTDRVITKAGLVEPAMSEWQEYHDILDYKGYNIAPPYYYSSDNGIGRIKTGDNGEVLRGFVRGASALYDLDLSYSPITATSSIGFRCAK